MHLGLIIPLALTAAAFAAEPIRVVVVEPTWHKGFAARYSLGVMQTAAKNHGTWFTGCGVALDMVPQNAIIDVVGMRTGVRRRCKKVDWSKPEDEARHIAAGLIELDHDSAKAVCGKHYLSRWKECPIKWARVTP